MAMRALMIVGAAAHTAQASISAVLGGALVVVLTIAARLYPRLAQ